MKKFILVAGIAVILLLSYFGCQSTGDAEHDTMRQSLFLIHSFLDSSSVYPDSAELLVSMGFLFASIDAHQSAIRCFEMAIDKNPDARINGTGLPPKSQLRSLLAIALWKNGSIDEAIAQMNVVAFRNPGNGRARYFLARMYYDAGDTTNAIYHIKLARWMGETYPEERLQPISVEMQIGSAPCRMCRWDI